jgi:hypothetical protein
MKDAGLNGNKVAHQLGWSCSRVSRLLSGKRGGSDVDVSAFLAVCGVKGAERERLLELCRDQGTPGWLQQHGSRLPKQVLTLIDHEDNAIRITDFQAIILTGLLQTGDYAREVISQLAHVPKDEIDDRVAARLARQSVFSRYRAPLCVFFIHESVLRLPVGGSRVMFDQLHHLLRMSVRPGVELRVVPISLGAHAGIDGSFILLEFAEFGPVVYLESTTSNLFLEKPEEIASYASIAETLRTTSLDEEESKELIVKVLNDLCVDEEDYEHGN